MPTATDNLTEVETMIRNIMVGDVAKQKALEICRWLLSFNSKETFSIKCYISGEKSKRPDIRFCIDRGSDCLGIKVRTNFVVIEPSLEIMGLYSKNPNKYSYYQPDNKRWRINASDISNLNIDDIKEHILESYCIKINELNLKSVVCS